MINPKKVLLLRSGQPVNYEHPDIILYDEDIFASLHRQRRYSGHLDITVLPHLALGRRLCDVYDYTPEEKAYWCMHDMHEAIFPDIPTPLKALMPEYAAMEERWERYFHEQVGMAWPLLPEIHAAVKRVDSRVCIVEATICDHHVDHFEYHHGGPLTQEERDAMLVADWVPGALWVIVKEPMI